MQELFQGILLGIVQGLTEFFPVSSSGHLILVPSLLGWRDQGLAFDTVLHVGTLVALFWAFRKEIKELWFRAGVRGEADSRSFLLKIVAAAIPGLAVGALFGDVIESTLRQPWIVAFDLAFWGLVLLVVDRAAVRLRSDASEVKRTTWIQALIVGFSQILALLPGTSRSGITMTGGMASGLNRAAAVTFSFYVSIPTITAAGAYGILKIVRDPSLLGSGGILPLIAGFIAAAISGVFAIRFLRSYVTKHSLAIFVWYRFALAAVVLLVVR